MDDCKKCIHCEHIELIDNTEIKYFCHCANTNIENIEFINDECECYEKEK